MSFPVKLTRFDADMMQRIEQLIPLTLPFVESLEFGSLFIQEDRQVTAVCFVLFEASVTSESATEEIMQRLNGLVELSN